MRRLLVVFVFVLSLFGCTKREAASVVLSTNAKAVDSAHHPVNPQQQVQSGHREILDAVILDLLTNPRLTDARDWYGSREEKHIGLNTKSFVPWPADYVPSVPGYKFQFLNPDREIDPRTPRQLGITIHHFAFPPPATPPKEDLYDGHPIAVGLFNIGGRGGDDGVRGGGCLVYYGMKWQEGRWIVEYEGSLDP
jgi:hypothetical protein